MSQPASNLRCRAFSLPKKGNSRKENEDAFSFNGEHGRFAVADGVSESVFAGEWASLLCESFVAEALKPEQVPDWRKSLQQRWLTATTRDSLPWYLEEKHREGAFATFLGLSVTPPKDTEPWQWQALAIGDSCLFHVRDNALRTAFPITRAQEFGVSPVSIGSRRLASAAPLTAGGHLDQGDFLLLMTDALAQWFLTDYEAGGAPWSELLRLRESEFGAWIDALRAMRSIKNDDVTLLVVGHNGRKK